MVDGFSDTGLALSDVTGAMGRRVARRLASAGESARLIVLDDGRFPDLPEMEVVEASYRDPASMRKALAGVHTFFMIPVHEAPDRVKQHLTAVDAAVAAGVKRIVYSSFVGAAPDATFTFARDHWHTEEHIRNIGLDFTFLRGNVYMDVIPWIVGSDGFIRGPAGDGHFAAVARDDVAEVAVSVLLGENHSGVTYEVSGPERLTLHQVAEIFSQAAGRDIAAASAANSAAAAAAAASGASGKSAAAAAATGESTNSNQNGKANANQNNKESDNGGVGGFFQKIIDFFFG